MTTRQDGFSPIRWFVIEIFLCITIVAGLWKSAFVMEFAPIITILTISVAVWLHGKERYGLKNIIIFFIITWFMIYGPRSALFGG